MLPYEIHVTVDCVHTVEQFKDDCALINVKPILLDIHNTNTDECFQDMMTSSTLVASEREALHEANRIAYHLEQKGYNVVRKKIETVPWHSAAATPTATQYFECHMQVVCDPLQVGWITSISKELGLHISRNIFKRIGDRVVLMLTDRQYGTTNDEYNNHITTVQNSLRDRGLTFVKTPHVEFALYDTNVSHDGF